MKLLEIIPGSETESWILNLLTDVADRRLGKGIVFAKDTPNFIANRIGTFGLQHILKLMQEGGYGIDEVDQWTGPLIGRPKSATFRTLDIVGIDTFAHVTRNIQEAAPQDEQRSIFCVPDFVKRMIELNLLGDKTGGGFYKKVGKNEILSLNLTTLVYEPRQKARSQALEMVKTITASAERLRRLTSSTDRAGRFLWENLSATITYAAMRIPEISDDITDVDHAMQWGFNWEMGPFQIWDALGVEDVAQRLEKEQKIVPQLVQDLLSSSARSFYTQQNGQTTYFDCLNKGQKRLEHPQGMLLLPDLKRQNRVILENSSASLVDLGDGVVCLEFHSKMNTIGGDTIQMIHDSVKLAEQNYRGLVIGNQGQNFSAGANLMLILLEAQNENWEDIEDMIRAFQRVNQAIKYASVPVVAVPFGLTLGGGCEICLHAAERVAAAETYIGLVELGVGLIPAAGGAKEMLLRGMTVVGDAEEELFPILREIFENIALAKVSGSADEARSLKFLNIQDEICMNRDRLLERAKARVVLLADAGYHKPLEPKITALGLRGLATFKIGMHQMRRGGFISEFDQLLGSKLAYVLCGGDCNSLQHVSEQYILDLEREVFLSLCGERKTQERIQHMLQKGRPLRN